MEVADSHIDVIHLDDNFSTVFLAVEKGMLPSSATWFSEKVLLKSIFHKTHFEFIPVDHGSLGPGSLSSLLRTTSGTQRDVDPVRQHPQAS